MASNANFPITAQATGLDFFVGNQLIKNDDQYRSGAEIKRLAGIDPGAQLYQGVKSPWLAR